MIMAHYGRKTIAAEKDHAEKTARCLNLRAKAEEKASLRLARELNLQMNGSSRRRKKREFLHETFDMTTPDRKWLNKKFKNVLTKGAAVMIDGKLCVAAPKSEVLEVSDYVSDSQGLNLLSECAADLYDETDIY